MTREILRVEHVGFTYRVGDHATPVLRDVSLAVHEGEMVAIQGPSGSGKSTLFYLLAGLLKPQTGRVLIDGEDVHGLSMDALAALRNRKIGFIFQQFHLLPRATVLDNILLPTLYPCESTEARPDARERARRLAEKLGIAHRLHHSPNQLSGGEQQRAAIARALMNDPKILLADEPTGNLDSKNAMATLDLLKSLNAEGRTIVIITHDDEVARRTGVVYRMRDGAFLEARMPEGPPPHARPDATPFRSGIAAALTIARTVAPLALSNLARNRMRAFLTMIGVVVGTAALFSMMTFGSYAKEKILEGYADLGVNRLVIYGWHNDRQKATERQPVSFTSFSWRRDVLPLKEIFPQVQLLSPSLAAWDNTANFAGRSVTEDVRVRGVAAEYFEIDKRAIGSGTLFSPNQIENRSPVCVIGPDIRARLFVNTDPIGQILFITGGGERPVYSCKVIGVLESFSSNSEWRKPNMEIFLPYSYFALVNPGWDADIHSVTMQLRDSDEIEAVSAGIKEFFKQKYGSSGEFRVDSSTIVMAQMRRFIALFSLMLGGVATITLGVGGMGINNMMLVAIAERLKEIGLRKSLGATDRTIRAQFLFESMFLCAAAGIVGILVGFSLYEGIIFVAAKFVPKLQFELVIDAPALLLSLASIVLVGFASGIFPAWKAERLQVMEAMRAE